ncbi:MAG: hypothetical protein LBT62_04985 [Deltaproteobacteria bacterium]|jgi:hypothetical protein|nr:hypothetical protein [Deltaproteobacteria bacterium]
MAADFDDDYEHGNSNNADWKANNYLSDENVASVDDVSVDLELNGETVVEQLDKIVLTKGAWSTILFRYRERDKKTGKFGPPKASLIRYNKFRGCYRKRAAFNLPAAVAKELIDTLTQWLNNDLIE